MKVAVVDWDVAYPANSGKRLRTLNLLLPLARRHKITYLSRSHADTEEARATAECFRRHGVETVFAGMPTPAKAGLSYYGRLLRNVVSQDPYAVAAHRAGPFAEFLRDFAVKRPHDVWQVEWSPYVEMLAAVPGARALLVAHNVDSLIWKRYAESEPNALRRAYIQMQHRRFHRFEKHAFLAAERVVTVSEEDAALARELYGVRRVDVVDNGVDLGLFGGVERSVNPFEVLFLGSLDWRPNLDAVRVLLDEVMPKVVAAEPRARLSLVGRNPPAWLREAAEKSEWVALHANVPDVRPYLATAGMMAVPLRIGGGSRLKILEALAAGVPVVASRVAAEGLRLEAGLDYALADRPDAMSESLLRWINDPDAAEASALAGRQTVAAGYGWDRLAEKLEASWGRCAGQTTGASSEAPT